jgi:hypothetical protein
LWHFYVYMHYNPNLFNSHPFSCFYISPLLIVVSTSLKFLFILV